MVPEKAEDAAGLTPSKDDNAFRDHFDCQELMILIRNQYESFTKQKSLRDPA